MYCENCGAKLSDGAGFCRSCGSVVDYNAKNSVKEPAKKQTSDFDYSEISTYTHNPDTGSQQDYLSTNTGSVCENEINRNFFLLIAVAYGVIWIINYFGQSLIPHYLGTDFYVGYQHIIGIIMPLAYSVYLAGVFICINKIPMRFMTAYMLPQLFPLVTLAVNVVFRGMPIDAETLIIFTVTYLSDVVIAGIFMVLTNDRIISIDNPFYPTGLLFLLFAVYFIISFILNIFFFQHGSDTISIMLAEFVPCVLAFCGFAAVQFIERKRES